MNVKLGLKKIESLELDKKNMLLKLFDAKELLNNVKIVNMLLIKLNLWNLIYLLLDLLVLNLIKC